MDGLTLPNTLRQIFGLKHKRLVHNDWFIQCWHFGVTLKDKVILNEWMNEWMNEWTVYLSLKQEYFCNEIQLFQQIYKLLNDGLKVH